MDTRHWTFMQTRRMIRTRKEPECELWTLGVAMGHCGFTGCNKPPSGVGSDSPKGRVRWGREFVGHLCTFPSVLL